MNLPAALLAVRWLVWDTFRQSLASRIFWVILGVTALCAGVCLSVDVSALPAQTPGVTAERVHAEHIQDLGPFEQKMNGVDVVTGAEYWTVGFGAVRVPWGTYREDAVRYLHMLLVGVVADTAGLLLALIWTAAFLPAFLAPDAVTVMLAKPVPRWSILAGKYLGVLAFMAVQATLFVAATWLALGVGTGVWDGRYFWSVPLLLCHFAVFFSFSAMLAVWTRSTVACAFGSLVFWLVCFGLNYGRHAAVAAGDAQMASFGWALEMGYWVLPKPTDMGMLLFDALGAGDTMTQLEELARVQALGAFHPLLSLASCLLFAVGMLAVAGYEFVKTDY